MLIVDLLWSGTVKTGQDLTSDGVVLRRYEKKRCEQKSMSNGMVLTRFVQQWIGAEKTRIVTERWSEER